MAFFSRGGPLWSWLDARLGLEEISKIAGKKEVPVHRHSIWYYLGGMTLFLFVIQIATGTLLLFYYRPTAETAYESVQFLMAEVQFGWLVRSIHAWSANLMIFALFLHLFSVLLLKAYRPPRELTWVSGFVLFAVALGFGFTGYLLPWNELAYFATRGGDSGGRWLRAAGGARGRERVRGDPDPVLRLPRGRAPGGRRRARGPPPLPRPEARHECAARGGAARRRPAHP